MNKTSKSASGAAHDNGYGITVAPQNSRPSILLASEGRAFSAKSIAMAGQLASQYHARVHVLTIARIWGSAFGLPHPGLQPNQRELQQQRNYVADAMGQLKNMGVETTAEVLRSRDAAKSIANRTSHDNCLAVVMTAGPEPHWLFVGMIWAHEPYRVRRILKLPVHLVVEAPSRQDEGPHKLRST